MIHFHDLALAFIAFISELLGTISGFGSSTFFVPSALYFENFKFVLALTAILHCIGNSFKIWTFRKDFKWSVFIRLALPAIFLTIVGAVLTSYVDSQRIIIFLGLLLMILPLFVLYLKSRKSNIPNWVAVILSGLSGFTTGFAGTGGAIRGVALTALQLEKSSFVAISSAIDIGGDLMRAAIYINNGFMDWDQWFYIPFLVIAAFFGVQAGKQILLRISQTQFEKIVAFFVFTSGLILLFK